MPKRRRSLLLVLPFLGLLSLGCGPRTQFKAPPMLLDDGVHVEVTDAFVRGDRIFIEAWVTNDSKKTIRVNPEGWAVKLPTGELIAQRVFAQEPDVYLLGPAAERRVDVDFRQPGYDLAGLGDMRLVVGGISIGESSTEFVVGEIPLTQAPAQTEAATSK